MSLAHTPLAFANSTDNISSGTVQAGTNFTAGASDADSTAVTVLSALAHDCHLLTFQVGGVSLSTANGQSALDILVDPAGGTSWTALINDIAVGFSPILTAQQGFSQSYQFPIWIKAGSSIGVRAKTTHTVDITTGQIIMSAVGEPNRPDMWWCGQGVETLGISDSRGTAHTPGASSSFSSFASVGSTTTYRYGALQLGLNGSDATASAVSYFWQVGIGGSQCPGTTSYYQSIGTAETAIRAGWASWHVDIPAGTQMQVRAAGSAVSPEICYCALYGVY